MDEVDARYDILRADILAWNERIRLTPAPVEAGSDMAADDLAAAYLHLSHAVQNSLHVASDHLHSLLMLVEEAKWLHAFAPYTLVRAALESAATVVWLLAPEAPEERVRRRLVLAMGDARYRGDIDALIGVETSRVERDEEVLTIAARSGLDRSSLGTPPGYETIITGAGAHLGNTNLYRVAWKGASGLAHGRLWATTALLRLEGLGDEMDGTQTVQVNPDLGRVVNAMAIAVLMTREAWRLYDLRRTHT